METIGDRFKQIRKELGMSQEELGKCLGLSKAAVSAVEKNRSFVSAKVLSKLFFDFNVNLNYFICGKGSFFNPAEFEDVKSDILKEVDEILVKYGVKNL